MTNDLSLLLQKLHSSPTVEIRGTVCEVLTASVNCVDKNVGNYNLKSIVTRIQLKLQPDKLCMEWILQYDCVCEIQWIDHHLFLIKAMSSKYAESIVKYCLPLFISSNKILFPLLCNIVTSLYSDKKTFHSLVQVQKDDVVRRIVELFPSLVSVQDLPRYCSSQQINHYPPSPICLSPKKNNQFSFDGVEIASVQSSSHKQHSVTKKHTTMVFCWVFIIIDRLANGMDVSRD